MASEEKSLESLMDGRRIHVYTFSSPTGAHPRQNTDTAPATRARLRRAPYITSGSTQKTHKTK